MSSESITLVSVCLTGLVSILAILIPAYLAYRKAKQERIAKQIERVYEKAEKLSLSLAKFRNPDYLKAKGMDVEARIELRANHDAWEIAIFSELTDNERAKVREMRKSWYGWGRLTDKDENGEANVMKLIDNVVEFSCSAIKSLDNKADTRLLSATRE